MDLDARSRGGVGRSGEVRHRADAVASGDVGGFDSAGLGRLRATRRLLEKEVVGRNELQTLLAGARLS
jgi:hypothetical protein